MFKKDKDLTERSRSLLKNKEIRSLKAEILLQFPRLSEDQISEIIAKKSNLSQTKLASRTIVYSVDDVPFFFDKEGRNNLYPTVFTLWRFPEAMRTYVVHAPVSEFVLNGADLMLPGLATRSSNLQNIFAATILF